MIKTKKINPFVKSSAIYLVATVIGQGASFFAMMIFTRIMSQDEYGMYSTYYAYVSLLTVLAGANLYYSINNAYIDYKDRIKEYRKSVLTLSLIIVVAILLLLLVGGMLFFPETSPLLTIAAVIHAYSFFVVNYRMYSANMENDYNTKTWLLILPNTLQFILGLFFVLVFSNIEFEARVVGSTVGVFICGLAAFISVTRCSGKCFVMSDWIYALKISVPSIVMSISYMLMQQCDKVMISDICGAEATAVYSVIYYLGYALVTIDQTVSAVRQAWVYKRLDENRLQDVRMIQKLYLVVIAFGVTGVLMVAPEIIKIIAPSNYWKYEYVVPFVAGACMMVLYRFYTEIALFYKKNVLLSSIVLASALVNIVLNGVLIPKFGAVAAAYATVVAYALLFVLSSVVVSAKIRGLYSTQVFSLFFIYVCGICGLFLIIYKNILGRYMAFGGIILIMLWFAFMKRNEWKELLLKG